jgi:CHAT domain-containing protein/tetratricopeptide (TPR) repeat protein
MAMKKVLLAFLIAMFLLPGWAAGQRKYDPTHSSTIIEALARGEGREVLIDLEAQGSAAEKNAASSPSPRKYWVEASDAYREASRAAHFLGQHQKAISLGTKSLEMAEKAKKLGLQAGAMYRLQQAYRSIGNYAKAREWVARGIETARQIQNDEKRRYMLGTFLRESGDDFLRQGKREEAIRSTSEALELLEQHLLFLEWPSTPVPIPDRAQKITMTQQNIVYTLFRLGTAYQRADKVEEGINIYERGLDIIKKSGLKTPTEAQIYWGLGDLYLRKKDFSRARENLQKALEMAEQLRLSGFIYLASKRLGDLYVQTQKPEEAIPYYKKAIENIESTRSLLESEEFRSSYFEDKRATYAGMILALLRTKNAAEAFNYSERARARAFLDILGSKVQLARGGTLLEQERALQARISVLQAMMAEQGSEGTEGPRLRQELEGAQKAYADFLTEVRKENKEQASLINVEPLTLRQVQELLDPGVTLLEYFVVRRAVLLWVVEKDRLRFVNIPIDRSDLVAKVATLRDAVYQTNEKERFNGLSQELYRLLIQQALPHIRGKELLIIPHDVLHYLPYQTLISGQGKYLIQDYPIYYLSSASLMQFTKEKRRASREGERALVLANPSLGDDAYNLRFAEREAKEVARAYPQSAVYLRADATKRKAISLSPNYDILHFAVHGELKEDDPLSSALLLAGEGGKDGRLTVREIFPLNLEADAVVLSACETALGKISNGDEIIGLTRAFIYAGTPSVIATLWKVNDRASYELMGDFYSYLRTMKKSEALRQAQLKTMTEFPQPFYWAAYELTGEP